MERNRLHMRPSHFTQRRHFLSRLQGSLSMRKMRGELDRGRRRYWVPPPKNSGDNHDRKPLIERTATQGLHTAHRGLS